MRRAKRTLLLLTVLVLIGIPAYYFAMRPAQEIRHRQHVFDTVGLEMEKLAVTDLLGVPSSTGKPLTETVFWGDEIREGIDPSTAVESIRYRTDTFFLPVTFEFTFDSNGVVIGKHRYD